MKKLIVIVSLFCLLSFILSACAGKGMSVAECCDDVIALMREMPSTDWAKQVYGLDASYDEALQRIKGEDYASPAAVYLLKVPKSSLLTEEIDLSSMSDALKDYLYSSAYTSLASRVNIKGGSDSTVVATVYSVQKAFVCAEVTENTVYLYVYETGCPILITLLPTGDGAVKVTLNLIVSDEFDASSPETIVQSFALAGVRDVVAEKQK